MKHKLITVSLACLTLFSWGCDNYLDINEDPNMLREIPDAKVVLPAAEIGLANQLMGWDFGFGGGFWGQYWTQAYSASQFKSLCEYQETSFGNAYNELTAGVLNDLERMKTVSAESTNKGTYFVAEALSIFSWQIMTDVWGSVPYFEALKGNEGIDSPKFDEGSAIYADLLVRVDALIATDLSGSTLDKNYDFVYAGNLTAWKAFATSLKLKLMMRLSETSSYDNAAVVSFIEASSFISSSAKIDGSTWSDGQEGKRHPMREFQEGGANNLSTNVIASKNFLDYLNTNNDPRLDELFVKKGGSHLGAFVGDFDSSEDSDGNGTADDSESYSQPNFKADMDLIIMSTWEINFFIAEAYARAGNNAKAKEYYDLGVEASLAQHGGLANDIITTGYATWVNGSVEEGIKQIAMQKWVANANYQHIESFLERNRTKYPAVNLIDIRKDRADAFLNFPVGSLTISVAGRAKTNAKLPSSPIYPQAVLTRNVNAPAQKADLLEKIWWNLKAE
ncbi:SusD/RagB family nutrient-binding outer membrane lipoprotein [Ancylomarina euxinus]|uniref:SusD/RagB family nutrient-binding outer membrane lipoprotein n=1 Tax=Ancylomarina euxinus TaxID=2283627 RepID=A0A425XY10_9BACT|nr:SusD/RagB family nutrient-binding outer membrane lipoprotein [Ancylomarina euxinus]MCZ4695890.1 SusD/RagB family nutrient-binding outer membrane lipoprotein [Ancylomarina euxinus]MUP16265.1 SusD/RagB family nutrient-binding outer membrane lipoprotein [Ancylomarina euxinus]RRG19638.1 SusD/RagB family nutrient-binding outer membrane lipoprotein [Ancylomarina euxinus]